MRAFCMPWIALEAVGHITPRRRPRMSEDITTPVETAPEATTPEEPLDLDRAKEKIAKANREAQQLRERVKALEPLAKRAQELDEAQKTEQQRLADQLAEAQKTAAERTTEALRLRIAIRHQISDEDAETFLTGATEEAMTRQAERLAAMRTAAAPAAASRTPVEALRPGALPQAPALSLDEQIAALMKDPHKNRKALISLQNQKLVEIATNRN